MCGFQRKVIIGLDPGSLHFGYAVIEGSCLKIKNRQPSSSNRPSVQALDYGVIHAGQQGKALSFRLCRIYEKLDVLFAKWKPDMVSVEEIFYHKNVKSAVVLAHARALGLLLCEKYEGELREYSPRKIKLSVAGKGSASKEQVQQMVCAQLGIRGLDLDLNISDALAVGLCAYYDLQNPFPSRQHGGMAGSKASGARWTLGAILARGLSVRKQ
ncbi:MAG: crossover junction endodeoxyribonuclease RuvC [Candidatus Aureabacteria bacterium]|nr:crossover junction endodeoxyribonuclease RuvC [Candidatus Auribacterota bacterium]